MELNITRLGLLLKRHFLGSGKKYATGIAIGVLVCLAISVIGYLFGGSIQLHGFRELAITAYLIGGIITTSLAFAEINKPETGYQMMTLPASSIEKYVSTWLFTSIVYSLLAFFVITLGAAIITLVGFIGVEVQGNFIDFAAYSKAFWQYFVGNIIFLAGAAAFKRNAFFKTMLCLVLGTLFFVLYVVFLAEIMDFGQIASSNSNGGFVINNSTFGNGLDSIFGSTETALSVVKGSLALFLLIVGFFKFKEREL